MFACLSRARLIRALTISILTFAAHAAASQGVEINGTPQALPRANDFAKDLPGVMLQGASLLLTERSRVTFTEVAAESGHANSLVVSGLGQLSENSDFGMVSRRLFSGDREQMTGIFPAGSLDQLVRFDSNLGDTARPGMRNFAAMVDARTEDGIMSFYLLYDDTLDQDGDFDDYIVRVDVEPLN